MRLELFDYPLPPDRIAQHPVEPRDASRLLVFDPAAGSLQHTTFRDLPRFLRAGDLLVLNDTRVLKARLIGRKMTGGAVEVLLLRHLAPARWEALVKPGRRAPDGAELRFGEGSLTARLVERRDDGTRVVAFTGPADPGAADALAHSLARVPLPPYITAALGNEERYQTIYACAEGSAAAPTAGLHFTPALLEELDALGVRRAAITLHVGVATFRPVRTPEIEAHEMHVEHYAVPGETARAVAECRGRVVAVGTTTVRCLESAATAPRILRPGPGSTSLYITPGFRYRIVEALITNFHMPRSSLLILVSAFAGRDAIMRAYDEALRTGYRFLSFGDAMLIERGLEPPMDSNERR